MTRNVGRGRIPSPLGFLIDQLNDYEERLRTLEAPDGQQLARVIGELQALVSNIQATLTDLIENDVDALIADEVTAQINAKLAGNVSIGGNFTVAGAVVLPNVPANIVTGPRTQVNADTSNGRLGRI